MDVTLDPKTTAIIVVDMQRDFCHKDGSLFIGEDVKKIIPEIKSLINKAKTHNAPVVFTQDWHTPDDPEFDNWEKHCVLGTEGVKIIEDLFNESKEYYAVRKRRYSAFFGTDLDLYLRERNIKTLVISGVVTNICVLHTAGDAASLGYGIIIPKDCVLALNNYDQKYGLHHISFLFKGKIILQNELNFGEKLGN